VPVRRRRQRDADRDDRVHGAQLPLLPPRRRSRSAVRFSRPRALCARGGAPVQPGEAADRPLREGDRGRRRLGARHASPVRAHGHGRRRPRARRRGRRCGDPEVGRDRPRLRLAGRYPAANPVGGHRHLRDSRQGLHQAPPASATSRSSSSETCTTTGATARSAIWRPTPNIRRAAVAASRSPNSRGWSRRSTVPASR